MKVELKSKSLGEVKSSLVDRIDDFGFDGEGLAFKGKGKVKAITEIIFNGKGARAVLGHILK